MTGASAGEPIGQSLITTVAKMPELQEVTQDYAELTLDSLVDSGIADDIPIVKTVLAFVRGVTGVREALLTRKLAAMLLGLGSVTPEEATKFREKLQKDEHLEDFGERVIGIVDRVESATKARIVGLMLRVYLGGRCDRATYLRSIEMVDRALTEDLAFLGGLWSEGSTDPSCDRLLAVGLMTDRSVRIVTEESQAPAPSAEGDLLRRSWLDSRTQSPGGPERTA